MTLEIDAIDIDCHDADALASFWEAVLGWQRRDDGTDFDEVQLDPPERVRATPLLFVRVPDHKTVKNRLHLDLRPTGDQAAEVARLEALGARRIEIGQSDDPRATWIVLADPEGNEFCVLGPSPSPSPPLAPAR